MRKKETDRPRGTARCWTQIDLDGSEVAEWQPPHRSHRIYRTNVWWRLFFAAWFCGALICRSSAAERALSTIETASKNVLVLCFTAADTEPPPSQKPDAYRLDDKEPVEVGRYSATLCEEKCTDWQAQRYPQIIGHRIYLRFAEPFVEGRTSVLLADGARAQFTFRESETRCESFKTNQVGYNPLGSVRDAFWAPWYGDLAAQPDADPDEIWLCDAPSGTRLTRLTVTPTRDDAQNGGPVWRVNLGALSKPGSYFLVARGAGRSEAFGFGDAFAHHTFFTHMRGLYHQRCGVALTKPFTEWERPACHLELEVTDAAPPGFIKQRGTRRIPHVGGHHDAGDFDVRLAHTLVAGWLLNAYELFPQKFTDGQLAIPESGNGIPDLLDEALFSIRAWEALQESDGGIRAGFESDKHPTYGEVNAATDKLVYRTFARHGHTTLAGAALMAYASRLLLPHNDKRSSELLREALRAWNFYEEHRDDPAFQWSHGALLFAACQLYLTTGDAKFHEIFREQARYAFDLDGKHSKWPAQYHGTYFNLDGIDQGAIFTHYFASYLLDTAHEKDPAVMQAARDAIVRKADELLPKCAGPGFATVSTGAWGAATGVGRYGDFLIHAWRLTGQEKYRDAAVRLSDWALGANPPGWCFTSGLGHRPPYNPLHLDSYRYLQTRGPAPGLVIYGYGEPAMESPYVAAVLRNLYPEWKKIPAARRVCDGWSLVILNEFTVWETLAPNVFLHACLAPDKPLAGQLLPFSAGKEFPRRF
jgi:endoglucanase